MKIQQIQLNPDPYKPFRLAQGYRVGDMLYISGQAAINESGQIVGGNDFAAQGDQAFANLDKVLKAGGSSLKNVVKVTIFVRDMASNFSKVVDLRGKYFTPPYPLIPSSRLPRSIRQRHSLKSKQSPSSTKQLNAKIWQPDFTTN